jgi:putative transposase|tara:strand:- start:61787 stop:62386 length:600 start_codon:yes stop_codon:yes gene_type:complete
MQRITFDRHRFPPDLIIHAVWLYAKFTLSYRDVEDLLAERALDVSYETVRRWFLKFRDQIANRLRSKQPPPSDHWHLDEMVMVVCGKRYWLWRAVDNEGTVLDFLVQSRRDTKAAKKLMKSLLKKHGFVPTLIVTYKLRSSQAAFRERGLVAKHIDNKRANNRAEGVSERYSGSNHQDLPSAFSMIMPPPKITSTTNVI